MTVVTRKDLITMFLVDWWYSALASLDRKASHHPILYILISLSLVMPPLFFLLLSTTQHYPLYDTTIPEHDHGSHASVHLTPGTCFRSPPRLHLLAALSCHLFSQPPTLLCLSPATICACMLMVFTIQPHRYRPHACSRPSYFPTAICHLHAHGTAFSI